MSKVLTPAELTFQSFQHSQGVVSAQALMFRYFKIEHGISADLHPSEREVERYLRYLGGAVNTGRHIDTVSGQTNRLNEAIGTIFKSIRDSDYARPAKPIELSSTELLVCMGRELLSREARIIDPDNPWLDSGSKPTYGRSERVVQRVKSGKASFLHHHGRDGVPTTHPAFDIMYQTMWTNLQEAAANDSDVGTLLFHHSNIIARAQARHLGEEVSNNQIDVPPPSQVAQV
ncbi:hypothetical protein H7097_04545 [Aeromicrobium sp.]|nr:hypothetical protein [Candidatus Saccharibacteria bacterium]